MRKGSPTARDTVALLIRHRAAIEAVQANPRMPDSDKYDLLAAVVWPGQELLAASLAAASERGA